MKWRNFTVLIRKETLKMLFDEIYSVYYRAAEQIIAEAQKGSLSEKKITDIIYETAFAEGYFLRDMLAGKRSLRNYAEKPLISDEDLTTPIRNKPTPPITLLEKRWLKSLLSDPRIKLFSPPAEGLEDVEPLFDPKNIVWFDRNSDGDPFEDENYIAVFKKILKAIKASRKLLIRYKTRNGTIRESAYCPLKIEYSSKDDKFRLIAFDEEHGKTAALNIAGIKECEYAKAASNCAPQNEPADEAEVTLELWDERNALERVMLHFSDLERETTPDEDDEKHYTIKMKYDPNDKIEIVRRILSFGPFIKVTAPEDFAELIKERIREQLKIFSQHKEEME